MASNNTGNKRSGNGVEQGEEFIDLRRRGVCDKDHVFVSDRKLLCEQVGLAVPEIEPVDDWRDLPTCGGRDRLIEGANHGIRLIAEQKHALGLARLSSSPCD